MTEVLFPFAQYWWFYLGFIVFVFMMLALDLGVFHREAHAVSFKEAATWSFVWVLVSLIFNFGFYQYASWKFSPEIGQQLGLEFLTGYLVEKSLAVDNIFIFFVVFGYFSIPTKYQHRVLFYGILGALFFRALFISLGSVLMQYHSVVIIFGGVLILTGFKMIFTSEKEVDLDKNLLIRGLKKLVKFTPKIHGQKFFIKESGVWHATPLFVALFFLEFTDVIFSIESVPAIFALTKEPLIVFTSNILAILGLRSMFFMLTGVIERFHLIKYGLALVLVFIGLKMVWLNEQFGGKFPISWSLGIIGTLILTSVAASLLIPQKKSA